MKPRCLSSSAGFTYLAVLMMVVIMGIILGAVGESMYMVMKREREEELLFRGEQIRYAIERWNNQPGKQATPLRELKDLLKDPRSLANVRYLRRLYKDPMTGEDFVPITDPLLGIIGVRSASEEEPARKANFPLVTELNKGVQRTDIYKRFEGKTKYSEWEFTYGQTAQAGTVTGLGNTPTGPNTNPLPGSRGGGTWGTGSGSRSPFGP